MKIRDYLLAALAAQAFTKRDWLISILTITTYPDYETRATDKKDYPFKLYTTDGKLCFLDRRHDSVVFLSDVKPNQPLCHMKQVVELQPGEVPTVTKVSKTLVGNLIFNYMTVLTPFKGKIPFQFGKCKIPVLENLIVSLLDDLPEDGVKKNDRVYPDEVEMYVKYGMALSGLDIFCVPTGSKRGFLPHPGAKALRTKMLEERKDRLNDPTAMAEVSKALELLDREWIAGDPDGGFYQTDKSFQVTRMRTFNFYGGEPDLVNGGIAVIEPSLVEGWKPEDIPAMASISRDASHSRGAMTALGGDKVKTMLRTTAGIEVPDEDCGSTLGIPEVITTSAIGSSIVVANKSILLTNDNIAKYKDQFHIRRSPAFCHTGPNNYCMACMGEFIRSRRQAVGLVVSEVGSRFMLIKMKAMHGSALKTVEYDLEESIS